VKALLALLMRETRFFEAPRRTAEETRQRILYFKDCIENKGGYKLLYVNDKPVRKESDIHILFWLVWFGTPSDVTGEANDGRGPADFKVSKGSSDKTLVEFKLASNSQLERNLRKQVEIYKKASGAKTGYKVIFFFTSDERVRVLEILKGLGLENSPHVILIDARSDNKPTGSKA